MSAVVRVVPHRREGLVVGMVRLVGVAIVSIAVLGIAILI